MKRILSRANVIESIRYSHKGHYLYLNNAKCGCSTIKMTLWKHEFDMGRIDYLPEPKELSGSGFWETSISPEFESNQPFVFSIVRNPYSRILSAYLDKFKYKNNIVRRKFCAQYGLPLKDEISFIDFLNLISESDPVEDDQHWRPQTYNLLIDCLPINFIGHLETLNNDMRIILKKLGIKIPIENRKKHATNATQKISSSYTEEAINIIKNKYSEDFKKFGYTEDITNLGPVKDISNFPIRDLAGFNFIKAMSFQKTDSTEAINLLRKSIKKNPKNPYAYAELAKILIDVNDFQEAQNILKLGKKRCDKNHQIYFIRGNLFNKLEKKKKAIKAFEKALKLATNRSGYYAMIAECYFRVDRFEEAIESTENAIKLTWHKLPRMLFIKGASLYHLNRFEESIPYLDEAIQLSPDLDSGWIVKLKALFALLRDKEAIEMVKNFNGKLAININLNFTIAELQESRGQYDKAMVSVERFMDLGGDQSKGLTMLKRIRKYLS